MPIKLPFTKEQFIASYNENLKSYRPEQLASVMCSIYRITPPTFYKYKKLWIDGILPTKSEISQTIAKTEVNIKPVEVKLNEQEKGIMQNLLSYVPDEKDPEIVGYKPRKNYLNVLQICLDTGKPILMLGEAGTGKTSISRYYAHAKKLPFLEVSCDSLLGFRELFGQVNITNGTSHFIEGLFTKFIQVPSVILLDEITALDPGKNFMLHQLLNNREFFVKEAERGEGKTYKLNPECRIILAANPPSSKYPGTNKLNVALVDRPHVIWIEELSLKEVADILPDHEHKEKLVQFYKEIKALINKQGLRTTFSVRSLKKIMSCLNSGMKIGDAVHLGFLNAVRATSGDDGYKACLAVAMTIWSV